ncbi:DUF262 domain-containing protein [Agrobacterium pusense]|uniref:DUF262 domain-containing protein n=1 Tax=Agrobacterium pusense TaxID=648995 RepID=UPI0021D013CA|nr:DUF262 domain-containing protein [Agrobacterium pusense]UXT89759.1 DUF262 domain-containing protein [Agrobacterium pusense]
MADEVSDGEWNDELAAEVATTDLHSLVVYSRDWTVETILSQIEKSNIDLNPSFQRRNAWNDFKRSKLIESLILGVPVPEIVLAEDTEKKKSFIVIDGKQRLLALAGFKHPDRFNSWQIPKLRGLPEGGPLNGKAFEELFVEGEETGELRQLLNADIRCTVLSNYSSNAVLYDVFYRLNTGSVPLSSQELRQVLHKGPFADFLIRETDENIPLHAVMNLDGPDERMRDAEILLRYIAIAKRGMSYSGNLTDFLGTSMSEISEEWDNDEDDVRDLAKNFHRATKILLEIFPPKKVGRKFANGKWESRFNRVLFETQVYYAAIAPEESLRSSGDAFVEAFMDLSQNTDFNSTIESTTKTNEKYYFRFEKFQSMLNDTLGLSINKVPVPVAKSHG